MKFLVFLFFVSSVFAADLKSIVVDEDTTDDTWRNVLVIASGSGYLHQVIMAREYEDPNEYKRVAYDIEMQINIDGGGYVTIIPAEFAGGIQPGAGARDGFLLAGDGERNRVFRLRTKARFESSLYIQVRQTSGFTRYVMGGAVYEEE